MCCTPVLSTRHDVPPHAQAAQQPACGVTEAQLERLWGGGGDSAALPRELYLPTAQGALRQHARWLGSHAGPLCQWLRELD